MNAEDRGSGDSLTAAPTDSTATQLSAGAQLGPYLIEGLLGAGGMGQVFRARDTRLGRAVAIKVSNAKFSDRFEREARAISSLNHPHICTLYDVGPNYLVMELVEGTPLKGPLPLPNFLQYAGQICDALDAAHRKGITHRDLKPANILLTKQGVKVLDFGLAHMAAEPGDPTLTQAGAIMGTPAYMAPEQRDGKQADARSDLYALGCVLYEMLTGKRPSQDWPGLETQPSAVASVVRTCLQKEPDDRWQAAGDLKRALTLGAMEQGRQETRQTRGWAWIAATILLLGAGLGIAVDYLRPLSTTRRALQLRLNPPEGERFMLGLTEGGMALSPDGNTVAYVASNKGKSGLWIQPFDNSSARLLLGTEGASYPFWSPDGRSIGFFAEDRLLRLDLGGGEPSVICSTQTGRGATWTQDGRIVFGGPSGLFLVPAAGGSPTQITKVDSASGEVGHRWPEVLPGGHFLYWVAGDKPENSKVYVSSLSDPGKRVQLLASNGNAVYAPGGDGKDYLLWLRGETLVAQEIDVDGLKLSGVPHAIAEPVSVNALSGKVSLTASAKGTLVFNSASNMTGQLTWFDRAGRPTGTLVEPGEYSTFRLSSDGLRVVAARDRNGGVDLWMLEADRNLANRLTSNSGVSMFPVWFPDSRTLLFGGGNPRNLFVKDPGGSERRLTQSHLQQIPMDVSRDGRLALYYEVAPGTQRDLWTLPLTPGDTAPQPYLTTAFNESFGMFSPEPSPHWIAYQSDESGPYEVYIDSFPQPSGRVRVSTTGGSYPQWGKGGNELFYVSADRKLMAVDLKLASGSVQASRPRELFRIAFGDDSFSPYEATQDGQRFLVRVMPDRPSLSVIVNWPALLKK